MTVVDSFSSNTTNVSFSWPAHVSGLERIMLAAQGDLQRLMSTFFARPISIRRIFANTASRTHTASPETPITQRRQVHLVCEGKTVCIATSDVTLTSPETERLFLDDKFAIGQTFRQIKCVPRFALLEVRQEEEVDERTGAPRRVLARRYTLEGPGMLCEIEEIFPDREMFVGCEQWLAGEAQPVKVAPTPKTVDEYPSVPMIWSKATVPWSSSASSDIRA